jgi:hypothetical protein
MGHIIRSSGCSLAAIFRGVNAQDNIENKKIDFLISPVENLIVSTAK